MTRRPSVLFFTGGLGGGGSERVVVNLANYLNEHHWRVGVIPFLPKVGDYELDPGVEVDRGIPQDGNPAIRKLRIQRFVMSAIRRFKPDVVVSLGAGYDFLALSRLVQNYQLVSSLRTDPSFILKEPRRLQELYKLYFAKSAKIVFQSESARSHFSEKIQQKSLVIDNPLADDLQHNSTPFEDRDREIITFGRMMPQKRLDILLQAFALFHERYPEYRLTIFGRGPERAKLENLVSELELDDVVSLEDFRTDIHDRIRNAAMYVSSSDIEGVSNAMLEAMALGLPSVCTDADPGGTREIIERFDSGVLTPKGDPTALAEAMIDLVGDPARANALIAKGAELQQELAGQNVYGKWASMLQELGADGTARRS